MKKMQRRIGSLISLLFILLPATLFADWSKDELAGAVNALFLLVGLFLSAVVVNALAIANGMSVKAGKKNGIIRLGIFVNSVSGAFMIWIIVKNILAGFVHRLSWLFMALLFTVSLIVFYIRVLKKRTGR